MWDKTINDFQKNARVEMNNIAAATFPAFG